jgi:hypothetical protein
MMYHDTGKTVVQLVLPRRLYGPHTGNRIQEALQFALGKRLFVLAQDLPQSATCRFCLFSTKLVKGEGRGPLHFKGRVVTADFQQLFLKYFAFVNTDRDAFWHPLSAASLGVVEAEAASLESKMLALGVGIEGVVRHFDLPGVCEGVSNVFLDSVIKLIELVGAAGLDQEAVDAATVKLKDLKTINPKRKIAQFLKFKGRQEALAKTWSTMRGKFAHGGRIPPESILDAEICYSKCLSLLHVLVFSVIGYGGSFCDCTNGDQVLAQWD